MPARHIAFFLHLSDAATLRDLDAVLSQLEPDHSVHLSASDAVFQAIDACQPALAAARRGTRRVTSATVAPALALLEHIRAERAALPADTLLCLLTDTTRHIDGTGHRADPRALRNHLVGSPRAVREAVARFTEHPALGAIVPRGLWSALAMFKRHELLAPYAEALRLRIDITRQWYAPEPLFWCRLAALEPFGRVRFDPSRITGVADDGQDMAARVASILLSLSIEAAGMEVRDDRGVLLHAPEPTLLPWLPEFRWAPTERAWAEEAMHAWGPDAPTLRLAVLTPPGAGAAAENTLRSVEAQWHRGAEPIVADVTDAAGIDALNAAVAGCDAEWIGVVESGDTLAADATFRLVDALRRHPDWQVAYSDEDILSPEHGHINPHFKPDVNIDYLRSYAYVGGMLLVRTALWRELGGLRAGLPGAELHDLMLRAWEACQARPCGDQGVGHVAEVLVHRATTVFAPQFTPPAVLQARRAALEQHFARLGVAARVDNGLLGGTLRVRWPLPPEDRLPRVSIIVYPRASWQHAQRCLDELVAKTAYRNYEILLVDAPLATPQGAQALPETFGTRQLPPALRLIRHDAALGAAAMVRLAAEHALGEFVLLLDADCRTYHDRWLHELVSHGLRADVGAVGGRLLDRDGRIRQAGLVLGLTGVAGAVYRGTPQTEPGHYGRAQVAQDYSALDSSCLLLRRALFLETGGLDPDLPLGAHTDANLSLRIGARAKRLVWTPYATLVHDPAPGTTPAPRRAADDEVMHTRWLPRLAADPAFNKGLSLRHEDVRIGVLKPPAWSPDWRPRPRILGSCSDLSGVGSYRIIEPMRALAERGLVQAASGIAWYSLPEIERIDPDTLIFQRPLDDVRLESLEAVSRHIRGLRIYEVDDLLTALPDHNPVRAKLGPADEVERKLRQGMALCDRLVVSTQPLADAFGPWSGGDVVVMPNRISRRLWGDLVPERAPRQRARVGWSGGTSHAGDLELIAPVIEALAAEVDFVFFGMCPPALRPYVREFHTGVPIEHYPRFLCDLDLDVALAPLEINAFNEAKSELKLLEYGILGIPVVCTDIVPYQGDWPAVRVANSHEAWTRAIRELAHDLPAARRMGDRLREHVARHWLLEDRLEQTLSCWSGAARARS